LEKLRYEIAYDHNLIGYVKYDIMREAIYDFFDKKKSGAEDTLLFYYSGHGIPISRSDTSYEVSKFLLNCLSAIHHEEPGPDKHHYILALCEQ
jgi:hypothetical protein